MDRLKSAACCRAGCRFVAGFVAGEIPLKDAGNAVISRYFLIFFYLFLSMTTKATKKSKKIRKGKTGSRIFACRFSGFVAGLRCRRRCQAQIHLWRIFAYGKNKENQQQKQKDRKRCSLSSHGSSPAARPCGKPLNSSLSGRRAGSSRNGWAKSQLKPVERSAGAWYYNHIVSLFIDKENDYEQEKSIQSEDNCPLLQALP